MLDQISCVPKLCLALRPSYEAPARNNPTDTARLSDCHRPDADDGNYGNVRFGELTRNPRRAIAVRGQFEETPRCDDLAGVFARFRRAGIIYLSHRREPLAINRRCF